MGGFMSYRMALAMQFSDNVPPCDSAVLREKESTCREYNVSFCFQQKYFMLQIGHYADLCSKF